MWIKRSDRTRLIGDDIARSEITPQRVFENRRRVLQAAGAVALGGLIGVSGEALAAYSSPDPKAQKLAAKTNAKFVALDKITPFKDITTYNNFYEFGTDKADPAHNAGTLRPHPWKVSVEGEIKNPKVYDIDELLKLAPLEERVYRLRCVEGWSMVIPWIGVPLSELIKRVQPTGNAKYVQFITLADPSQMPGLSTPDARLAVFRRPAHGRSDESADAADDGPLRRRCCRIRTARRCASSCRGSTASRARSRW